MSAFDIGGRIVIDGDFDDTFDALEKRASEAERALDEIGLSPSADTSAAEEAIKQVIESQLAEVEKLQEALAGLRAEVDTDEADAQLAELQKEVDRLQEKLAGGEQLSAVETDFLAGAQEAVEGLKGSLGGAAAKGIEAYSSLLKYGKAALGVAGAVATVTGAVFNFIKSQGMLGEELLLVERSFRALSGARGIDSSELLAGLEEASRGAVTAGELMKQANQLILRGAEEVAEKLPQLYDAARASAQLTGRETAAAFQGITQSVLALDEAGLHAQGVFVNLTAANEAWAEANGRLVGSLSKTEKQMIAADAAIAAAVPMMRELGLESATVEERLAELPTAIASVKDELAKAVAEGKLFQGILDGIGAFGNAFSDSARQMAAINELEATRKAAEGLVDELLAAGEIKAGFALVVQAKAASDAFTELRRTAVTTDEYVAGIKAIAEGLARATEAGEEGRRQAATPELRAFDAFRAGAADTQKAADATTTFAAALAKAREGIIGVNALEGQFAGAIAEMEGFIRAAESGASVAEMPDMSANLDVEKMRAWGNEMEALSPATAEANAELQAMLTRWEQSQAVIVAQGFAAALADAREQATGLAAVQQQFLTAILQGEGALQALPEMPDITATMDVNRLREWGDAWAALNPRLASANQELQATADTLAANQVQVMASAAAIPVLEDRVRFLVTAFDGADAEIGDFVASLGVMSPEMLAQIGPADSLAAAIARLRSAALDPISIDVALNIQSGIESTIEGLARRIGRLYDADTAKKFYDTAIKENAQYWTTIADDSKLGQQVAADDFTAFLTDMVNKADPAFTQVAQSAKSAFEDIGLSVGELRSKIESALMEGATVTAQDFADTLAGTYEDAPLEAARRLDAVAARGFAELQAHPDWAAILEIPPDVLAGSEAALKSWATNASASVRNLERADLIDWDAFAANFQAQLDREAAREYTLDVALSELDARGLLSGSEEDRRKQVEEALGMGEPRLTFEALFKAEENANENVVSQVGEISLPTMLKMIEDFSPDTLVKDWLTEYDSPSLVIPVKPGVNPEDVFDPADSPSGIAPIDAGELVKVEEAATDLQLAGARAIELVEEGAETYLLTTNIAGSVAASWSTDFAGQAAVFETIGTSMGNTVGAAFLTAMETNAGQARRRIAELVAPEVAAILNQSGGGSLP